MHHRRRRSAVGVVLLAVVTGAAWLVVYATSAAGGAAHAGPVGPAAPLAASVDAAGTPVGQPSGWRVQHVDRGRYVIDFADRVSLSLASWEVTATVILRPLDDHSWQVDFVDDHRAVDSAFSFTAVERP